MRLPCVGRHQPCADGRLKGLSRYILRLPISSFTRRTAYAGACLMWKRMCHWERNRAASLS
ncbi:MAG: carboxysome shell carbonic anhydrase [Thiolinea sp.]